MFVLQIPTFAPVGMVNSSTAKMIRNSVVWQEENLEIIVTLMMKEMDDVTLAKHWTTGSHAVPIVTVTTTHSTYVETFVLM